MFEDYDEIFCEPTEVEKVIQNAISELTDLFTEKVKNTIEEAKGSEKALDDLKNEIRTAEYKLARIKEEIDAAEERQENSEMYDIPRKYIKRFVEKATGNYAPDDIVYTIENEPIFTNCAVCNGNKKVKAFIGGETTEIACPKCNGRGSVITYKGKVVQKKIKEVRLKLCFHPDRVSFWSTESVFLERNEHSTKPENIYPTEEAALEALRGEENG